MLSPASAFIANQYRAEDDVVSPSEIADNVRTVTGPTTPTTLVAGTFASTSITRDSFAAFGISFEHPKHWRSQTFGDGHTAGSTAPVAYLSEDELSDRARPHDRRNRMRVADRRRLVQHAADHLDLRTRRRIHIRRPTTIIGGNRPVGSAKPGACGDVKGEETIVAAIARPVDEIGVDMRACLSGSELEAAEQNVYAMLASVGID